MDTISRENNSMLPVAGVIAGVLGVLLGGIALVQLSKVKTTLAEHQLKVDKVDAVEAQAGAAAQKAEGVGKGLTQLAQETQGGFNSLGAQIAKLTETVTKLEEAAKKPVVVGKPGSGNVVAGPGEYVVKAGDVSGAKIARDKGVSLADLMKVNPGVNWSKLHTGQKIKLPVKAPAASAK